MTKHRPTATRSPQWWKHLRDWKQVFWKRDRQAGKKDVETRAADEFYDGKSFERQVKRDALGME